MHPRAIVQLMAALLLLPALASPARAQSSAVPSDSARWSVGATLDRFGGAAGEGALVATLRVSSLQPRRLGPEFGVGVVPAALAYRTLVLTPDLGAAFDMALSGADLLLKGGFSALLGVVETVEVYPGYHVGLGAIVPAGPKMGVRVDVARRTYFVPGDRRSIWSVGFGFTSLPRRSRSPR